MIFQYSTLDNPLSGRKACIMINEICPKIEVIETVIKSVIIPILQQLETDLGELKYKCSVYVGDKEEYSQIIDSSGVQHFNDNTQPIRVRFRTIAIPNKLKFHVESVFSKDISPEGTGFSGFNTDGSINIDDLTIKKSAWAVRYSLWDWKGWKF